MGFIDAAMDAVLRRKPSPYKTQGTGGTYTIGGFLISPEKSGELSFIRNRVKKYDEIILNTAIVATGVRYYSSLISGVGWTVAPAKPGDRQSEQIAEIIEMMLDQMDTPFHRVARRAAQFRWMGFSIQEWIAKRMDDVKPGFIGVGAVEQRPQVTIEQWDLEEQSGEVVGWLQRDLNTGVLYPLSRAKAIYLVDDTLTNMPDGIGLMRHIVPLVDQLHRLEQLEGWGYETDLRGVPIGYAPTGVLDDMVRRKLLSRAEADAKLKGINDFITNHFRDPFTGLLLDSSVYTDQGPIKTPSSNRLWGLELAKGDHEALADVHKAIERKQHEIARCLGIEQFMLGSSGKGSLALSEDKSANLQQLISSTLMEVAWTLEHDFLDPVFAMNNWDIKLKPKLLPDAVQLRSVAEVTMALFQLAQAGATLAPNDPVVNQVRDMLHLVQQPDLPLELMGALPQPGKKPPPRPGQPQPTQPAPTAPKKPDASTPDEQKTTRQNTREDLQTTAGAGKKLVA